MSVEPIIPSNKTWTGQFHIGRSRTVVDGFRAVCDPGGWIVSAAGSTRTQPVTDGSGRTIGCLIGVAIDHAAGKLVEGGLRLDWPTIAGQRDAAIERELYALSGSWVCLLAADGFERIYLDADGTLSLVYDPLEQAAASTTGLLLDEAAYSTRFDTELYDALDVRGEGWFPSGLTAHMGIKRLLCNHYLNLADFVARRHWPVQPFTHQGSVETSALRVAEIVRRTAEALLKKGKVVAALTGGNETRFLLAAYKPFIKDLTFVTVEAPSTTRDVSIAKRLAETFGLRHIILPLAEATPAEQAAWHYATGHTVTGPNMASHPTIRPLLDYDYFLGGLGGEIGRAFFWRPTDTFESPFGAPELVPRFGMPVASAVLEATERWLESVTPQFDGLTVLDLAYLELRMSAWSAAQTYAQAFVEHQHPLIAREIYALMLNLPPEAKRGNLLIKSGIAQLWPELEAIPINRYGDYRDTLHVLMRAADGKRVAKKLRKLFG